MTPNWIGVALLVLSLLLLFAELHTPGVGLLAVLGIASFVMGLVLLELPVQLSPWLLGLSAAALAGLFALALRAVVRTRRAVVRTGIQGLLGKRAVASELAPDGTVRLEGESWRARADDGAIRAGEPVRVTGVEGVTLHVVRS